jgi:chorismate mutase
MRESIDGASFAQAMIHAAASLNLQKQQINELNVFPVPDGDTGTNMSLTLGTAAAELRKRQPHTVGEAACKAGISRSAFYKYKDAVRPFQDMLHGRIVTFQTMLRDEPGVLSGLLNVLAGTGMNILTINQNIPVNGCAVVTITAETSQMHLSLEDMLQAAADSTGVIRCEVLAG